MRQASAHSTHRLVHRALRRQQLAALQMLACIDPKSVERSTVIGIALFAASSIALQAFVIAQGNISGRSSGVAQAAIVPHKVDGEYASRASASRKGLAAGAIPIARRGDLLNERALEQFADDRDLPRIASLVPADTIIAKPVTAADLGLRVSTLAPHGIYARDRSGGLMLSSRRVQENNAQLPRPTRVAFAGAARSLGHEVTRESGSIFNAAAPLRVPAPVPAKKLTQSSRVPNSIVKKVHFQEDTPDRCLPAELMNVIYDIAEKFGEVQILSTFRDPQRNRRVGGAPRSFHLRCQAIDFRVMGQQHDGLLQYLENREDVGGLKRYPLGFYHIDTGPRRTW